MSVYSGGAETKKTITVFVEKFIGKIEKRVSAQNVEIQVGLIVSAPHVGQRTTIILREKNTH